MPLDPIKVRTFRERAIQAGYSGEEINSFLGKKQQETYAESIAGAGIPFGEIETDPTLRRLQAEQIETGAYKTAAERKVEETRGAAQAEREVAFSGVEADIQLFERNLQEMGKMRGPVLGRVPTLGGVLLPEAEDFEAMRGTLAYSLAKAIGEQKGQGASDKDIRAFKRLLPKRADTAEVAENKMGNVRAMIASRMGEEIELEEERPAEALPTRPPDLAEAVGGVINEVAEFFFPETSKLVTQTLTAEMPERPPALGEAAREAAYAGMPGLQLLRKDQVGRAAREIGEAALIDFATLGVLNRIVKPAIGKITGPAKGLVSTFLKAKPAARTWLSSFTIPTKLGKKLKLIKTADEMLEHGVVGSLDEMAEVVSSVTGDTGIITKLTRDTLAQVTDEVPVGEVATAMETVLEQGALIDKPVAKRVRAQIGKIIPIGKEIGKANALDAFSAAQELEKIGYDYLSHTTYLTKNIRDEQIGKTFLAAADEIMTSLNKTIKAGDVLDAVRTPETMSQVGSISRRLAEQVGKARNLSELRSTAAPFVRLGRMVDLTQQAAQSAFNKLATTRRGLVGAALSSPMVRTRAGKALRGVAGAQLPAVPPRLGRVGRAGLRLGAQTLRGAAAQ